MDFLLGKPWIFLRFEALHHALDPIPKDGLAPEEDLEMFASRLSVRLESHPTFDEGAKKQKWNKKEALTTR